MPEPKPLSKRFKLSSFNIETFSDFVDKETMKNSVTYVQESDEDYTRHEFETISKVKVKMYQKFNKDVSELINLVWDEVSGEELLKAYGEIVT